MSAIIRTTHANLETVLDEKTKATAVSRVNGSVGIKIGDEPWIDLEPEQATPAALYDLAALVTALAVEVEGPES